MTNDTTKQSALDFEDPGELSNELLSVPGFVNELKEHTMKVAPRPNEPLAFAGALAMLAHLSGRSYRDTRGTRTNLYIAALAPSGMGKDEPRTTNKRLAEAIGILGTVPDSIASGEGLEDAMAVNPSLLLQSDEADTLLTAMRGEGGHASKMNEMILRFFSEAKSAHALRQKAGDGKVITIPEPHLTMFATGIPKFFYGALSAKSLENGLLGRCLFLESPTFCRFGKQEMCELPANVVETARYLAEKERAYEPIIVGDSIEAAEKIEELKAKCDEVTAKILEKDLGTAAALYVRIPEKVLKLALLWALSENPYNPQISSEGVIWATKFVTHLTRKMLYQTQFYVAEGKFDRLKKRALAHLAKAGGSLDRATLVHKLAIDSVTFKNLVKTLEMCNFIESEMAEHGKVIYHLTAN